MAASGVHPDALAAAADCVRRRCARRAQTGGGTEVIGVIVTLLPPVIIEVIRRSNDRTALHFTGNVMTINDLGGQHLPPHFHYSSGDGERFRRMALGHVVRLKRLGHPISPAFMKLARASRSSGASSASGSAHAAAPTPASSNRSRDQT